jgi:ectoine hydroxylase-related dioxygenase (phytanoyl-CoA dioxygenase family)
MSGLASHLDTDGFVLVENAADARMVAALKSALADAEMARAERGGETFGARNLLGIAAVGEAAKALRATLHQITGGDVRAVRGLFFDKTEAANWPVPWHQDLTIAEKARRDLPGWTNWTVKRGVPHAQAPAELLSRMITARLHLDDCGMENGPLRVIPGSHANGTLARKDVDAAKRGEAVTVCAKAGDVLLMKPLLLHASSPAQSPTHRRVLHLEFAPTSLLPGELAWADEA